MICLRTMMADLTEQRKCVDPKVDPNQPHLSRKRLHKPRCCSYCHSPTPSSVPVPVAPLCAAAPAAAPLRPPQVRCERRDFVAQRPGLGPGDDRDGPISTRRVGPLDAREAGRAGPLEVGRVVSMDVWKSCVIHFMSRGRFGVNTRRMNLPDAHRILQN